MHATIEKEEAEARPKKELDYYRISEGVSFLRVVERVSISVALGHFGIDPRQKKGRRVALAAAMNLRNSIMEYIPLDYRETRLDHIQKWYLSRTIIKGINVVTDSEKQETSFIMRDDKLLDIQAYLTAINTHLEFHMDGRLSILKR
jgi:hypothetical protein